MCGYIVNLSSGNPKYKYIQTNTHMYKQHARLRNRDTDREIRDDATRTERHTHTRKTPNDRIEWFVWSRSCHNWSYVCVCVLIVRARTCAPCESLSCVCVCASFGVCELVHAMRNGMCLSLWWGGSGCLCCNCAARQQRDEALDCARARVRIAGIMRWWWRRWQRRRPDK